MKKVVFLLALVIAYGIYVQATGQHDVFQMLWAVFAQIVG